MKNSILKFHRKPRICSSYSVVGHLEHEGPLGECFDEYSKDDKFGKESWEKAESEMQRRALSGALKKSGFIDTELDVLLAGDLLNQCVGSNYALSNFDTGFLGLYGACSTCAEGLLIGSCLYAGGIIDSCAAVTSSHYCSSERQFRFPLEYGGQRTPTAQWTTTGAGAFVLCNKGGAEITEALVGKVIDKGISDINNMGAAMARAAFDTIYTYFSLSGEKVNEFDYIVTGDLGYTGSSILRELISREIPGAEKKHVDCGTLLYDKSLADVHSGASGCGCSASVLASHFLPLFEKRKIKRILFMSTGALMSPGSVMQGENILGIAPLLKIEI